MSDPRRTLLVNAWAQWVLAFVAAVLLNTCGAQHFWRADLTSQHLYSLDPATKDLVARLDKPLVVKVVFTRGLEAPYNNYEQIVSDKLGEIAAFSKGLVRVEHIDPDKDAGGAEEAAHYGITPIQYRFRSESRAELRQITMGVALLYGGKQQVLPAVTQTDTLEYDLARALKQLVSDEERRTVAFSAGFGEPDFFAAKGPLATLRGRLAEQYDVERVPLGGVGMVPDEVDALFVVGPSAPLNERARYQIDQFLMRGGALAIFATSATPDLRVMRPQQVLHGLEPLLQSYGVELHRDLVLDRTRNGVMNFPVRQGGKVGQVAINFPLIPRAVDLDRDNLVVKDLDSMLLPFTSTIALQDPLPPGLTSQVLAKSSSTSMRVAALSTLDPNRLASPQPGEEPGQFPLLVSLTGMFPSAFRSPVPPAQGYTPTSEKARDDPRDPAFLASSSATRLVVAGSADFVANNMSFVLNLADWMVQDEALVGIRSKRVELAPIEGLSADGRRNFLALNLGTGPLLLVALAVARAAARRRAAGASS